MNEATNTRGLISVVVGGQNVRGTYHKPRVPAAFSGKSRGDSKRVGIVFLNSGFLPRAAAGDSAVYWAEALANCGYPCFRFDLPGLGDSDGKAPEGILDYINAGGYSPVLSATVKWVVKRYELSSAVIIAHCAGGVSAVFAAASTKECSGLVVMDPYFHLPKVERPTIRKGISAWVSWSKLGAGVSYLYDRMRYVRLLLKRNRLPENANLPLIRCWRQLLSEGLPILILKAPGLKTRGLKPRMGEFDYLTYIQTLGGRNRRLTVKLVDRTNHSFADDVGRRAVREQTEQWLRSTFGFAEPAKAEKMYEAVNSPQLG